MLPSLLIAGGDSGWTDFSTEVSGGTWEMAPPSFMLLPSSELTVVTEYMDMDDCRPLLDLIGLRLILLRLIVNALFKVVSGGIFCSSSSLLHCTRSSWSSAEESSVRLPPTLTASSSSSSPKRTRPLTTPGDNRLAAAGELRLSLL